VSRPLLIEGLHVTNDVDLRADIELSRGLIHFPAPARSHLPAHGRGVVLSEPGLYFMSLPSQFGHNSALIDWRPKRCRIRLRRYRGEPTASQTFGGVDMSDKQHVRQTRLNPRDVETVCMQCDQAFTSDLEGDRPKELRESVGVPVQHLRRYRLEVGVPAAGPIELS